MQKNKKLIAVIIFAAAILLAVGGILLAVLLNNGQNNETVAPAVTEAQQSAADYYTKRIGVMSGSIYEGVVKRTMPDASVSFFDKAADMAEAVSAGTIDAFVCSDIQAAALTEQYKDIKILDVLPEKSDIAFAFPKNEQGASLRDEFNEYLSKIKTDGTYDALREKWNDGGDKAVEITVLPDADNALIMATTGTTEPYTYMSQGRLTGLDIDLAADFSREYGYNLDIRVMEFGSIIPGLSSGEFDLAGANITITEERAESVYFSDSYTSNDTALVVKASQ